MLGQNKEEMDTRRIQVADKQPNPLAGGADQFLMPLPG